MFVGFIAVIVILLVIVGLMSTGALNSDSNSYITEVKKIQEQLSIMKSETKFYYVGADSFTGLNADYYKNIKFGYVVDTHPPLNSADWSGWPTGVDTPLADPYTGPYITFEGIAKDNVIAIPLSVNNGEAASIFIMIRNNSNLPISYKKLLEKTLATDQAYIGG